jgi:gp32 DNA binding protein like
MSTPINTKSMFEAIKQSLSSSEKGNGGNGLYKEILKFTAGNTYLVRIVPNPKAPAQSIFKYFNHAWTSNSTGKFVTSRCPGTFGETCPIDAYYLKTYRTGTESEKKSSADLSRKTSWMANVYVIEDPTNKANEGQVKILRYGKELAKIIDSALEGDDASEFGVEKVFDVEGGSTLRIKCEQRAGAGKGSKMMVTYASSKFLSPSKIDVDVAKVYESIHDLTAVDKSTTTADMQRMLDEHFFNLTTGSEPEDDNDEDSTSDVVITTPAAKQAVSESDETTDEKLKKLLEDL